MKTSKSITEYADSDSINLFKPPVLSQTNEAIVSKSSNDDLSYF